MRIHDLRHAYASILASSGLSLPIIDAHTQPDDDRNAQSARCLTRLAENLKNLPDHHFQLLVVAALDIGIPGEIEPPEMHEWRMRPF
ncbi:MAG: hypothetical protein ACREH3_07110 [Geminicoccales bacterium]